MKKLSFKIMFSCLLLFSYVFMLSITAFASDAGIKYIGENNQVTLNKVVKSDGQPAKKPSTDILLKGDGLHNSVYAREVFVYAGFLNADGTVDYYNFPGNSKSFAGNNETGIITISQATKQSLDTYGAANNMTLVSWLVRPKFEVYSDNPYFITYRYYGVSDKTDSISEGIYEINYEVPVGETNGRFSGYLTFRTSSGKVSTSQFVLGAVLPN